MQTKPNDVLTSWLNRNESIIFLQLGFLFREIWWKHVSFWGLRREAKTNKQINKWSIYVLSYFASVEMVGGKGGLDDWCTPGVTLHRFAKNRHVGFCMSIEIPKHVQILL